MAVMIEDNTSNVTDIISPPGYLVALRFFVSLFCILSIVGSLLIIFAYFAFKETRTQARQFLVNLSIADLITALANLIGLLTNFERFGDNLDDNDSLLSVFCTVQAFFAQLGTNSSILWTIVIALYMFFAIVLRKQNIVDKLLPQILCYTISWGIPAVIMIWFAAAGFLGFEPNTTPGWCAIQSDPSYAVTVGYTVFVYIAFLVLPLISIFISCYLKILAQRGDYDPHMQSISRSADLKLALIPLIFVFLRVWGLVVDILTFQIHDATLKKNFEKSTTGQIMIVLEGIGDSSQGFANSILFVGLTPAIRSNFLRILKKLFCCCCTKRNSVRMKSVVSTETANILNSDVSYNNEYGSLTKDDDESQSLTYQIHTD